MTPYFRPEEEEVTYGYPNFLCAVFGCKWGESIKEDEHTSYLACKRCKYRQYFGHFKITLEISTPPTV